MPNFPNACAVMVEMLWDMDNHYTIMGRIMKLFLADNSLPTSRQSLLGVKSLAIGIVLSFGAASTAIAQNTIPLTAHTVTFEQVLANPDNQDLNLHYASQKAKQGDYLSAASALERMLYSQPNWDSARVFYAVVLEKLDDKMGVVRELELLQGRSLSAHQRSQISVLKRKTARYAAKMGQ